MVDLLANKSGQVTKDKKDMGNYITNAYNSTVNNQIGRYTKTKNQYKNYLTSNKKYENTFVFEREQIMWDKVNKYKELYKQLEDKEKKEMEVGMSLQQ